MAYKVLMTAFIPEMPLEEEIVTRTGAELVKSFCFTEDEIIEGAQDADAIIAGATMQPFTRRVIEKLTRCRIIANIGIGYDRLDVEAATEHGICVANVPDYCLGEVSDHAMLLILALARKLLPAVAAIREGKWMASLQHRQVLMPIHRLQGQTLGLVGLGRIGRALVPKAHSFGLRVIAYDPYVPQEVARGLGVNLVDLDELLKESDFVSLHAHLTKENEHMIGLEQFKKMKPSAYFINTARGQLVDEQALKTALTEGYIAGAGLDVMDPEPPSPDDPLLQADNVIVTGHSGQLSLESDAELWRRPLEEVARVLQRKWPVSLVNPEVKKKFVAKWGAMK